MIPRLLDVTLRDGGYVNEWRFRRADAVAVVSVLSGCGIPFIEVGYYNPRLDPNGAECAPKYCPPDYLTSLARARGQSELVVMIRPADVEPDDYGRLADCGIARVRFVVPLAGVPSLDRHIAAAHRRGLTCSVNLIRLSERAVGDVVSCAKVAEAAGADWLYGADSNGSMFPDDVERVFTELSSSVRIPLGFHAHNHLQLAFANSLAAVRGGCQLLDSSLAGMGKGAGNLTTELIVAYLDRMRGTPCAVSRLDRVAGGTLGSWISPDHSRRCEWALAGLLDLNADDLRDTTAAAHAVGVPVIDRLEQATGAAVRHRVVYSRPEAI
jgi:4-hydroxy 2-oxovalerate aldolase